MNSSGSEYKFTSSPKSDSGNSSMIFERTVEDGRGSGGGGSVSAGGPRQFSRHGSSVSLLSRKYSNQSTGGGLGIPITRSTSRSCGHRTPRNSQTSSPSSPLDPPELAPANGGTVNPRRHLENLVAPALDASCSIIADDSANLNDLDIVYMRRPSTIGLDMALGRTRSNSYATLKEEQQRQRQQQQVKEAQETSPRSDYSNPGAGGAGADEEPKTLRFYSYADMLSDEMATSPTNNSRPPLLHSASSMFLRPAVQPMKFSNPFQPASAAAAAAAAGGGATSNPTGCSPCGCGGGSVDRLRKDSMVSSTGNLNPNTRRYSNNFLTRSGTSPMQMPSLSSSKSNRSRNNSRGKSAFQIESSGSDEFSSEEDEDENMVNIVRTSSNNNGMGFSPLGPRVSRTSTSNSINSQPISQRARDGSFSNSNPSLMRRESFQNSINSLLMDDTLQTEKVGDILRKRMGNVKKQDVKITTGED